MIGRVEIDGCRYVIELTDTHATMLRVEPLGKQPVRITAKGLYNFAISDWDMLEVERIIRRIELERLFDTLNKPASAGNGRTP